MVVHTHHPSWEVETGGLGIHGHLQLHSELEASLVCVQSCFHFPLNRSVSTRARTYDLPLVEYAYSVCSERVTHSGASIHGRVACEDSQARGLVGCGPVIFTGLWPATLLLYTKTHGK